METGFPTFFQELGNLLNDGKAFPTGFLTHFFAWSVGEENLEYTKIPA